MTIHPEPALLFSTPFCRPAAEAAAGSLFSGGRWADNAELSAASLELANSTFSFTFDLNAECPLLAEHFPGFAVAPASLILGLVRHLLAEKGLLVGAWQLRNLRLQKPMLPGTDYCCQFQAHAQGWQFSISQGQVGLLCKGIIAASQAGASHHAA